MHTLQSSPFEQPPYANAVAIRQKSFSLSEEKIEKVNWIGDFISPGSWSQSTSFFALNYSLQIRHFYSIKSLEGDYFMGQYGGAFEHFDPVPFYIDP